VDAGARPVWANPRDYPGGVVSSATYATIGEQGEGVAPGSLASVFGSNLSVATVLNVSLPWPSTLGGSSVLFNGVAVPLSHVSP
jgi:uncharacterized protein (TIGR03437 family)